MARARDYKAEYARRTAKAEQRGLSRSQGRGHARTGEAPIKGRKAISDERLEAALKILRRDGDQMAAAKALNIAPERFRRFLRENVEIVGRGRNLKIIDNRPRDMTVISDGQASVVQLRDYDQASLNGEHWAAIKEFVATNNRELLEPFAGRSVIDAKGKAHPLETDPNTLHRIVNQDDPPFHEIYRLVFNGG